MDPLLAHRKSCNPKPGPALYALRSLALALAENSAPAGRLVGNKIVHPPAIDVGFAVEAEDGVLVPVLRNADKRVLKELMERYNELVELARQRRLPIGATGGSIATVTNYRDVRIELGDADSAAGTNFGFRAGRRSESPKLGRTERSVRSRHGSEPDS